MDSSKSRNYFNQAPHVCALSAQEPALSERSESKGGINRICPFPWSGRPGLHARLHSGAGGTPPPPGLLEWAGYAENPARSL